MVDVSGSKRRSCLPFLLVFALIAILLAVYLLVGASRIITGVSDAQDAVGRAESAAGEFDLRAAQEEFRRADESLAKAESGAKFFGWTRPIPWLGDQVKAVSVILHAAGQSLDALDASLEIATDVYGVVQNYQDELEMLDEEQGSLTFGSLPDDVRQDLLQTLTRSSSELQRADVSLKLASEDLDELEGLNVTPRISQAIEPFQELLPDLIAASDFLVPFSESADDLAGIAIDRQWLLLFMNDMEIRPGGGFLGVYGLGTVRNGDIADLQVSDTFSVDALVQNDDSYRVAPPDPIRDYTGVDKWYFRDANWSPDFAESSRVSVQLLRQELAQAGRPVPEIHGVLGVTPTFASRLIELTGPITIEGEEFNSENLPTKLEFEVEQGYIEDGIAFEHRKAIVGELTDELADRLIELPIEQYPKLFATVARGFREKQVGLYSPDESVQAAFSDAGWSGKVGMKGHDDVLMVVDANMVALKSDPAVKRDIRYTIDKQGDDYVASTSITYDHTGEYDFFTSRYRTYTRVYAPPGSELISVHGAQSQATAQEDLGLASFGAFTVIEPGEKGTLTFVYRLPPSVAEAIESGVYELQVLKQMGAQNNALTLHLDFGKKVKAALPSEDRTNFGDAAYTSNTILDQNKSFVVELE